MAASDLIRISFDSTSGISVHLNPEVFFGSMALFGLALAVTSYHGKYFRSRAFEIESAEFGFGNGKISLKPNEVDQQIAYAIWVELSTRKIGLSIDPEKDVIYEVYDSWFSFLVSPASCSRVYLYQNIDTTAQKRSWHCRCRSLMMALGRTLPLGKLGFVGGMKDN